MQAVISHSLRAAVKPTMRLWHVWQRGKRKVGGRRTKALQLYMAGQQAPVVLFHGFRWRMRIERHICIVLTDSLTHSRSVATLLMNDAAIRRKTGDGAFNGGEQQWQRRVVKHSAKTSSCVCIFLNTKDVYFVECYNDVLLAISFHQRSLLVCEFTFQGLPATKPITICRVFTNCYPASSTVMSQWHCETSPGSRPQEHSFYESACCLVVGLGLELGSGLDLGYG